MPKPPLPTVPESVREAAYKPSGKCTLPSLIVMSGMGLLAAGVVASVGPYLGVVVIFLAQGITSNVPYGTTSPNLVGVGLFIIFGAAYLGGLGAAFGGMMWLAARWSKCRNSGWATGIGLVEGILASAAFVYFVWWMSLIDFGSLISWVIIIGVGIVLVGGGTILPLVQIESSPFCESCEEWYGGWQGRSVSLEIAEPLLEALLSGSTQSLEKLSPTTDYPHMDVKLRRCPSCDTAAFLVGTDVAWKEVTKGQRGIETTTDESEEWFTTMVSADVGRRLQTLLFGESQEQSPHA